MDQTSKLKSTYNERLDLALKLALEHPESGILQELPFMNEIEHQASIDMHGRYPID